MFDSWKVPEESGPLSAVEPLRRSYTTWHPLCNVNTRFGFGVGALSWASYCSSLSVSIKPKVNRSSVLTACSIELYVRTYERTNRRVRIVRSGDRRATGGKTVRRGLYGCKTCCCRRPSTSSKFIWWFGTGYWWWSCPRSWPCQRHGGGPNSPWSQEWNPSIQDDAAFTIFFRRGEDHFFQSTLLVEVGSVPVSAFITSCSKSFSGNGHLPKRET